MKTKQKILALFFIAIAIVCVSCGSNTMKDKNGNTYKTVKIGDQVWMAENLNYETSSGSWCYDDDPANCEKYGRLYDWETAITVCPKGWRLPSKEDFDILLDNFGGEGEEAYNALKDGGSSGFSALFGGWRGSSGSFDYVGKNGSWWSSSENEAVSAWGLDVYGDDQSAYMSSSNHKEWGFSVRCLQD